jgi:nicotinate-nucleotide adenylyltransferase
MLALATRDESAFRISTIEIESPDKPYTFETLTKMKSCFGENAKLFFVMGADSWSEITTWREWQRVLSLCNHIVVSRPGFELQSSHITPQLQQSVVDTRGMRRDEIDALLDTEGGPRIFLSDLASVEVSATAIRHAARAGRYEELVSLVPGSVAKFIDKYRLYRNVND